jgi:orotate phosphoribosyltransferase
VEHALCVIDRQEGGAGALITEGITLLSLLSRTDLDSVMGSHDVAH